jgi:hypothetical protein
VCIIMYHMVCWSVVSAPKFPPLHAFPLKKVQKTPFFHSCFPPLEWDRYWIISFIIFSQHGSSELSLPLLFHTSWDKMELQQPSPLANPLAQLLSLASHLCGNITSGSTKMFPQPSWVKPIFACRQLQSTI